MVVVNIVFIQVDSFVIGTLANFPEGYFAQAANLADNIRVFEVGTINTS
jgi:hypothetical protein